MLLLSLLLLDIPGVVVIIFLVFHVAVVAAVVAAVLSLFLSVSLLLSFFVAVVIVVAVFIAVIVFDTLQFSTDDSTSEVDPTFDLSPSLGHRTYPQQADTLCPA